MNAIVLHIRGVGLVGSTAEGEVGAVLGDLPGTLAGLKELVGSGGSIDHVGDPGVPIIRTSTSILILLSAISNSQQGTYQPGSIWSGWNSGQLVL